jgi:hypothetical protein
MMPALLLAGAALVSYAGFACLALAMPEHWGAATGTPAAVAPYRRRLRPCGFLLLGLSCALCWYRDGPGFGLLLWMVLLSAAAVAVALTLSWQAHCLLPSAWRWRRPRHGK